LTNTRACCACVCIVCMCVHVLVRWSRYPPKSANEFARKYLNGGFTYYTAPEESDASVALRMEAQDEALTPMEVLLMLFPDVEPALLEAAFQEANGKGCAHASK